MVDIVKSHLYVNIAARSNDTRSSSGDTLLLQRAKIAHYAILTPIAGTGSDK